MLPRRLGLLASAALLALAACGGDDAGDAGQFCREIEQNREVLTSPDLGAADDPDAAIDALVAEYRRIGDFAPLAVEEEWDTLVSAYEAADDTLAGDVESEQSALESIFRAEQSAVAIADWVADNCGFDLGPVATIVPEVTTTLEPDTTDAP